MTFFLIVLPRLPGQDVREGSLQSPIEQLDRAAEAAVRRLKAFHPESSGDSGAEVNSNAGKAGTVGNAALSSRDFKRGRGPAYIRREETRHAMWAKREWSGLQGFTQEEQVMMDVSDLGSGRVAEDGIPLGQGWLLQISGVVVSGRRKSLGSKKADGPAGQVLRDWGPPVLLPQGGRWWHEALSSLPQTPLAWEEDRRSSGRHSVASLELFAGTDTDFSTATCPRMSPRHTLFTDDTEELEVFNLWTGQMVPSSPEHCLVVAPQTSLPGGPKRPSFFRRRSTASTALSESPESSAVRHVKSHPGVSSPQRSDGSDVTLPRPLDDETSSSCSGGSGARSQTLVLPPLLDLHKLGLETGAPFDPDKSPLFQRRRRKAISSDESATSLANLSTTDGSGCWN